MMAASNNRKHNRKLFYDDDFDDYHGLDCDTVSDESCSVDDDTSSQPSNDEKSPQWDAEAEKGTAPPSSLSPTIPSAQERQLPSEKISALFVNLTGSVAHITSRPKLRYADPPERSDLFPRILDDDTLILIIRHLPLGSISALSCASKSLDDVLSSDFFYCRDRRSDRHLPCLRDVPILSSLEHHDTSCSRPKGMARKFAMEAEIYAPRKETNIRQFKLIGKAESVAVGGMHLVDHGTLSFATTTCDVITRRLRSTGGASSLTIPNCTNLLCAAFSSRGRAVCATLASSSSDRYRYLLSLTRLPSSSTAGLAHAQHLLWQYGISRPMYILDPSLHFGADGRSILFGRSGRCTVFDASVGEEVWSTGSTLGACKLSGNLVVGVQHNCVKVYDVRGGQAPVASGPLTDNKHGPTCVHVFGGRLWVAADQSLLCTDRIVRQVRGGSWTKKAPLLFHSVAVAGRNDRNDLESSVSRLTGMACHGNHLCASRDNSITCFDKRNLSTARWTHRSSTNVDNIQMDDTKVVYSRSGGRIEILPIECSYERDGSPESVLLPRKFIPPHHRLRQFQFGGRALAVSHSDNQCGDISVFDIQEEESG